MGVAGTSPGAHEAVGLHAAQQMAAQQAQHGLVGPLPTLPALPHAQGPVQLLAAHTSCQRSGDYGAWRLDRHAVIMPAGHILISISFVRTSHLISLAPPVQCCCLPQSDAACLQTRHQLSRSWPRSMCRA